MSIEKWHREGYNQVVRKLTIDKLNKISKAWIEDRRKLYSEKIYSRFLLMLY